MHARQRLLALARGDTADRIPVVVWSVSPGHRCDAAVVGSQVVKDAIETHPSQAILAEIMSPLGRAIRRGLDVFQLLADDPGAGATEIELLETEARDEIARVLAEGADGIFYRLDGAYPAVSSPMQYGGHFLEVDRRVLACAEDANFNILRVEGQTEVYFDCLGDLPAHALAWDYRQVGMSVDDMRAIWPGLIAAPAVEADLLLVTSYDDAVALGAEP